MFFFLAAKLLIEKVPKQSAAGGQRQGQLLGRPIPSGAVEKKPCSNIDTAATRSSRSFPACLRDAASQSFRVNDLPVLIQTNSR